MVSQDKQQLSAWMDGELSHDELVQDDQLQGPLPDELKETWDRYHLVGETLRNETPAGLDLGFADRISAAIADEPTIIAPDTSAQPAPTVKPASKSNVIPLLGRFGQYGIAASVAAAMVIGVQQYSADQAAEQPLPVLQTMPVGGYHAPVSLQTEPASQVQQRLEQNQRIEQQRRLNALLQDHRLQQRLKSQADAEKSPSKAQ